MPKKFQPGTKQDENGRVYIQGPHGKIPLKPIQLAPFTPRPPRPAASPTAASNEPKLKLRYNAKPSKKGE